MMNLKDLVPPLELCKLIPEGEFADSAMVRCDRKPYILRRDWIRKDAGRKDNVFPAPTLEEIMASIPFCRVYKKTNGIFIAVHEKTRIVSVSGVTAALKMWLKLKGIEA